MCNTCKHTAVDSLSAENLVSYCQGRRTRDGARCHNSTAVKFGATSNEVIELSFALQNSFLAWMRRRCKAGMRWKTLRNLWLTRSWCATCMVASRHRRSTVSGTSPARFIHCMSIARPSSVLPHGEQSLICTVAHNFGGPNAMALQSRQTCRKIRGASSGLRFVYSCGAQ
ncbi:hypothetical protein DFH09DRAFT_1166246 [Mycena vulgaris]|nr:hypothetical protein DFH09DRAFT_1166246 [Mycena vulgaris]